MTSPNSLRVGITIGLRSEAETLWNNGIKQNAVFLAEALRLCPNVSSTTLVNTTAVPITPALPWDLQRWPTRAFEQAKDELDVVIELGGQISAEQTDYLHQRGCKLISYCCGVEYVNAMQAVLFDRPLWGSQLFVNQAYDAIWMVPQVAHSSQGFFETLRRRPAHVVPFVWSPVFLEQRSQGLPEAGVYQPRSPLPRRISVIEPNIDVVKFCLYPILIAEEAYRSEPNAIERLQVTNAERMARENMDFIALMNQLDIVREHKAVFLGRYDTPQFLAEHTDVVVSHQWENPLNYFYLEVCWQGFPLVHNASLCPDLGYFYPDNDVTAGAARLLEVLRNHDAEISRYREEQRHKIQRYLVGNATVTREYTALLEGLY
ncbi:DUF2827 domain-containing protein [Ottowia thiooxydans]|uniref:DUF2827 domain-containing protein n=1 Tax=Ottowia thiooxydans TaxID=219182 RepID=UPI0004906C0D|nr:DUF2827 domain-containing protein [Ottowia thiooxydans]